MELGLRFITVIVLLGSVGVNVWLFFQAKRDQRFAALAEELEAHAENLRREIAERLECTNGHGLRLSVMEQQMKALPTHEDLGAVRESLSTISESVATVNERSRNTHDAVRRIEQHLLERAR